MPFIQVKGQIIRFEKVGEGHNQRLTAVFSDGKNTIELVWFKGVKYAMEKYHTKVDYVIFGKPSPFNGRFNIVHPEIEIASKMPPPEQMGLVPFYNTSEKMKSSFLNSKTIQKIIFPLIQSIKTGIPETLLAYILQKFALMNLTESLVNVHFPKNADFLNKAQIGRAHV